MIPEILGRKIVDQSRPFYLQAHKNTEFSNLLATSTFNLKLAVNTHP